MIPWAAMLDPFSLPFFQRGIVEVLLLALAAGVLGTWIILRGLAFFAHAVGTATFPGLVIADGVGFSAALGAFGAAIVVAGLVALIARQRRTSTDSTTALVLAGALAAGVILASDVYGSRANVDTLLFGSLLTIDGADLRFAAFAAAAVLAASALLGPRWLADGFRAGGDDASRRSGTDVVLFTLVALTAVASLAAVGSLLATSLLVVPAATTRLLTLRLRDWQLATIALAAVEGVGGLWLAYQLNVPPGATIAVTAGSVFVLVAVGRALAVRRRAVLAVAAALLGLAALAGCGSGSGASGKPAVAVTTTQLGDIVRVIGGADVHVDQILHPNSDPHEYEPRPKDAGAIADAGVVFVSGLGLDSWSKDLIDSAGGAGVVDVGASVPVKLQGTGDEAGGADPHWWHDPANVSAATITVADALGRVVPGAKARFEARAADYRRRLARLDAGIRACVAGVPSAERRIVTDHDAFRYFTRRYGVTLVGAVIPSTTTRAEASAGELAALERVIGREHVKAIFPESSVNRKLAERIANDTGASAAYTLYGDTLGPAGSAGATYLTMERANADAIVRGMTAGARRCAITL